MRFVTSTILRFDSKTCFRDNQSRCSEGGEDSPGYPHRRIAGNYASCISKSARGAHDLETSAVLETGVDVQIGGGVRVGDAFKANVESRPIAIWVTIELCRNFSSRALRSCEL